MYAGRLFRDWRKGTGTHSSCFNTAATVTGTPVTHFALHQSTNGKLEVRAALWTNLPRESSTWGTSVLDDSDWLRLVCLRLFFSYTERLTSSDMHAVSAHVTNRVGCSLPCPGSESESETTSSFLSRLSVPLNLRRLLFMTKYAV